MKKEVKKLKLVGTFMVFCLFLVGCSNDDDSGADLQENGLITQYRVNEGQLSKIKDFRVSGTNLEFQRDTEKHNEIWELTKQIVPKEYLSKINEFIIFSGKTDGTLAYVSPTNGNFTTWQMGIAIDFAYEGGFNAKGELTSTIVHEFGHILTFDPSQADATVTKGDCSNYFDPDFETCSKDNSYLDTLYKEHWVDIWSEFLETKNSNEAASDFYAKYIARFVTPYASTDPAEDIAEVLAAFVVRADKPQGSTGADKKIQQMYDRDKLVSLRNQIRANVIEKSKNKSWNLQSLSNVHPFDTQSGKKCGFHKMNASLTID